MKKLLALLAVAHLLATAAPAADKETEGVASLEPPRVIARDANGGRDRARDSHPEPLIVGGILTDVYYRDTTAIDGFVQQEPREGKSATEKTEASITTGATPVLPAIPGSRTAASSSKSRSSLVSSS
jgi:hypothetical protein